MTSEPALDRDRLLERLRVDLIGPDRPDELLNDRPGDVYLSGILWPRETRVGGEDLERLGAGDGNADEGGEEEEVPLTGTMRPCVAGLSFAVGGSQPRVSVLINCALYEPVEHEHGDRWQRHPLAIQVADIDCEVPSRRLPLDDHGAPAGVALHVRSVAWPEASARLVTITLINEAHPAERRRREIERVTLFQTRLTVSPSGDTRIVPRPSRRAVVAGDTDDQSAALLYRTAHEFAVGHTCSASWDPPADGTTGLVRTEWLPDAIVPAVSPEGHPLIAALRDSPERPLLAASLAELDDAALGRALLRLPQAYRTWLADQTRRMSSLPVAVRATAAEHLRMCEQAAARMEDGARRIAGDEALAAAFRLANRVMVVQSEWAQLRQGVAPDGIRPLVWRPFQLGFLLLSGASAADDLHADRRTMDLLWFPTGGGKTEAYLGLIAFVAFARRLRRNADGVAALMRYTLRLLTTQQFVRAATMIFACEAIRRGRIPARDAGPRLGPTPFAIGLWLGGDATPNSVQEAAGVLDGANGPSPAQLVACPACGATLVWSARRVRARPTQIDAHCAEHGCVLHDEQRPLPVHTVDEDVYRARPTLLIGTVDKFAQIVRRPEVGRLFDAGGTAPPDLIIQDELHLISGALGTMVGLYEAGFDRLLRHDGRPPKVIGSTATIRRAADQIRGLFNRDVCQFPPPAIDADDSGFAVRDQENPGRRYVAVTTAGRSAKFALQAVAASLLQSAAGAIADNAHRDPYWTLVTYFNSLRELGGALVLMQDDVPDSIQLYAARHQEERRDAGAVEELTSRRTQTEVRDMLDSMGIPAGSGAALDVVLATNMLSVGVDIPRLGLMVVNGQPKGIAEYIQATSRVGRRHPGLVVAVLNSAKVRDRSHYETFRTWHATLYRDVEATSVTPFASRARDRALHAALVAAARHLVPGLSDRPALDAARVDAVEALISDIAARAAEVDPGETAVSTELQRFLRHWQARAARQWWNDHDVTQSLLVSAEAAATLRAQGRDARGAVATPNSMRNVEAGVPFRLISGLAGGRPQTGGGDQQ